MLDFLGAFARSPNSPITFIAVVSVCLNLAPTGQIFVKFDIKGLSYSKSVEKIQLWVKADKDIGHLTRRLSSFYCCRRLKIALNALLRATSTQKDRIVAFSLLADM